MNRPDLICLDVDEVVAQWVDGMLALLGRKPADVHARWDALSPRPWDVVDVLGVSQRDVRGAIDSRGAAFWANLRPFPWLDDLYSLCSAIAPTYLLTSPSTHPSSLAGKLQWIHRHFGRDFRDYLIGPAKHVCARPGTLLIDDRPETCIRFREHGGAAILFPGVGNELHVHRHNAFDYIRPALWSVA